MQHSGGVGRVERRADLPHDRDGPRRRQRPGAVQQGGHVGALDEAHVHVQLPVDLTEVVNRYDVRFLQTPSGAGLPLHPCPEDRIVGQRLRHQLQRHDPLAHRVLGLIDVAHPAAPDQPSQQVRPELRTLPRIRGRITHRRLLTRQPRAANRLALSPPAVAGAGNEYAVACQA